MGGLGQVAAYSSVLFTGDEVGIRIRNAAGSGIGNDHAFDDIRVLDVTPQGLKLVEKAAGVSDDEVKAKTACPVLL